MLNVDFSEQAISLLGFTQGVPKSQSRRIAAIYASFFEEDALIQGALGVLAIVEGARAHSLNMNVGFFDGPLAEISEKTYRLLMPEVLRFRVGLEVEGPLSGAFATLREAQKMRELKDANTRKTAEVAWGQILTVLDAEVVQGCLSPLPSLVRRAMAPYLSQRMPASGDEGGGIDIVFPDVDPGNLMARKTYLEAQLMPAWLHCLKNNGAPLVGALRHLQLTGWFKGEDIPKQS